MFFNRSNNGTEIIFSPHLKAKVGRKGKSCQENQHPRNTENENTNYINNIYG